jgi:transcriptional regulator GlxA family with amidase domain
MAPIRFGIPLYPYQAIDVVGSLDVIAGSNINMLKICEDMGLVTKDAHKKGLELEFYHIQDSSTGIAPVKLDLENITAVGNTTCADCPPLDYLLLGGPMPDYKMPDEMIAFIKDRVAKKEIKTIFTTCTGSLVLAQTGLLDGKRAAVNHSAITLAEKFYPAVNWVKRSDKLNWVVDGNIWTASTAVTGMDMFAHWLLDQCGLEITKITLDLLGHGLRGVDGKYVEL